MVPTSSSPRRGCPKNFNTGPATQLPSRRSRRRRARCGARHQSVDDRAVHGRRPDGVRAGRRGGRPGGGTVTQVAGCGGAVGQVAAPAIRGGCARTPTPAPRTARVPLAAACGRPTLLPRSIASVPSRGGEARARGVQLFSSPPSHKPLPRDTNARDRGALPLPLLARLAQDGGGCRPRRERRRPLAAAPRRGAAGPAGPVFFRGDEEREHVARHAAYALAFTSRPRRRCGGRTGDGGAPPALATWRSARPRSGFCLARARERRPRAAAHAPGRRGRAAAHARGHRHLRARRARRGAALQPLGRLLRAGQRGVGHALLPRLPRLRGAARHDPRRPDLWLRGDARPRRRRGAPRAARDARRPGALPVPPAVAGCRQMAPPDAPPPPARGGGAARWPRRASPAPASRPCGGAGRPSCSSRPWRWRALPAALTTRWVLRRPSTRCSSSWPSSESATTRWPSPGSAARCAWPLPSSSGWRRRRRRACPRRRRPRSARRPGTSGCARLVRCLECGAAGGGGGRGGGRRHFARRQIQPTRVPAALRGVWRMVDNLPDRLRPPRRVVALAHALGAAAARACAPPALRGGPPALSRRASCRASSASSRARGGCAPTPGCCPACAGGRPPTGPTGAPTTSSCASSTTDAAASCGATASCACGAERERGREGEVLGALRLVRRSLPPTHTHTHT